MLLGRSELEEIELNHLDGYKQSRPVRIGNGAATHPTDKCCVSNATCRISTVNCEFLVYLKVCLLTVPLVVFK